VIKRQGKEVAYSSAYHRNKHRFQKTIDLNLIHCYYGAEERHSLSLNLIAPMGCKRVEHNHLGSSSYSWYCSNNNGIVTTKQNQKINKLILIKTRLWKTKSWNL